MKQKLIKLLDNCYSEIDKFKCSVITVTNDNKEFNGVNIKNSVYRDSIYAEVSSITNAVSNGYKKGDFKSMHILTNSDKYKICSEIIKEFFDSDNLIYIYSLNSDGIKIMRVADL